MAADETPSRYPYLISVRGGRPVPARKDGSFYVCAYQTFLGLWWPPREVQVLEYDPHRDFYREQRQAYLDAHPEESNSQATPTPPAPAQTEPTPAASPDLTDDPPALWERVASRPVARPTPPQATAPPTHQPWVGW